MILEEELVLKTNSYPFDNISIIIDSPKQHTITFTIEYKTEKYRLRAIQLEQRTQSL